MAARVLAWRLCEHEACDKFKPICRVCCKMEPHFCGEHSDQTWTTHDGFDYHGDPQRDERFFTVDACVSQRLCTKCHEEPVAPAACGRREACVEKEKNPRDWCGPCLGWRNFTGAWMCAACNKEEEEGSRCIRCNTPSRACYWCRGCGGAFCHSCNNGRMKRMGLHDPVILAMFCRDCAQSDTN